MQDALWLYLQMCMLQVAALMLVVMYANFSIPIMGEVYQLTSSHKDHSHVCEGNLVMCTCTVTGSHLMWMNSPQLLFTSHDKAGDNRFEQDFTTVLLANTQLSDSKWKLSSILFINVSTSNTLSTNISCSSNSDSQAMKISIAGNT